MKSWYDLDNKIKKEYLKEFKTKNKTIDLRFIWLVLSVIFGGITILRLIIYIDYDSFFPSALYDKKDYFIDILPFIFLTIIALSLLLINSVKIKNRNKNFDSWLETKNIKK